MAPESGPRPDPVDPGGSAATASTRDLLRWSEALGGIARTGLGFTKNLYEAERYQEVLAVAADIRHAAEELDDGLGRQERVEEWMRTVGQGIGGYVTPKVAVGAVVDDGEGRFLLTQRPDSGFWLYPVGWADIGYSPSEVAVKEVREECGIECEPVRLLAVLDGLRLGISFRPLYSLVFYCRATGGTLQGHPLETSAVGWFNPDDLPSPVAGWHLWGDATSAALRGEERPTQFDLPRQPAWRTGQD